MPRGAEPFPCLLSTVLRTVVPTTVFESFVIFACSYEVVDQTFVYGLDTT